MWQVSSLTSYATKRHLLQKPLSDTLRDMLSTVPLIAVNSSSLLKEPYHTERHCNWFWWPLQREKRKETNSISHKRTEEPSHRRGITESGGWLGKLSGGLSVRHVARILTITPLSPHRQYCTNTILKTDNNPHCTPQTQTQYCTQAILCGLHCVSTQFNTFWYLWHNSNYSELVRSKVTPILKGKKTFKQLFVQCRNHPVL